MALKLGPNQPHGFDIEAAAARIGVESPALAALIAAEAAVLDGRWDPKAHNPRTSAAGLAQFLEKTWLDLAMRATTWLHAESRSRGLVTASGKIVDRAQLLAMRLEPKAAIMTAADYARLNLAALARAGVVPTDADHASRLAYLAHHEGAAGALAMLQDRMDEPRAERLLKANVGEDRAGHLRAASASWAGAYTAWLTRYIEGRIVPARFRV